MSDDLRDLIERLEGARDSLAALAAQENISQPEWNRLTGKREGVVLALSYAREATR